MAMEDDATATTTVSRPGIGGVTPEDLEAWFTERGHPAYRARQVLDAAWGGQAAGFAEILTLPAPLRDELETSFGFDTAVDREVREADGGLTEKVLHTLDDGRLVESVLMHYPARGGSRERAHAVHQLAGRLRGRLPVLRDRRARLRRGTSRPPRSSTRSATRRGCWRPTGSA